MKLLIVILTLSFWTNSYSQIKHNDLVKLKLLHLNLLDSKYRSIYEKGEREFSNFKNWYLDKYSTAESRKNYSAHTPIREIVAALTNRTDAPRLSYNQIVDFINVYFRFNTPHDYHTIIIDGEGTDKVLYRSLVYYTIGILAELQSSQRTYIDFNKELTTMIELVVNGSTKFLEKSGSGTNSITNHEQTFFKLYISMHAGFPLNLTKIALWNTYPRHNDSADDVFVKSTLWMDLTSYCLRHCTTSRNFTGIQDYQSFQDSFYYLLKQSYKDNIYKHSFSNFEFQDYRKKLLESLDAKKDAFAKDVRSNIAISYVKSHLTNIAINFSNYAKEKPLIERVYLLSKYITAQLTNAIKHLAIYMIISSNISFYILLISVTTLILTGKNSVRFRNVNILTKSYHKNGIYKTISKALFPLKYLVSLLNETIKILIINIIGTYKKNDSPLMYRIAVQGIIVSITIYITSLSEFIENYSGNY